MPVTNNTKDKPKIKKSKVKIKEPPIVFERTQAKINELAKNLGCPVLVYFKPPGGNIWSEDLYAILECLKSIGKVDQLAIYIRSNGGSGMISLRIINLLRYFVKKLIILAPSECASAATMLALGCDEIHMGPLSSLSPVDSSLTHPLSPVDKNNNKVAVSLDELQRVIKLWKVADSDAGEAKFNKFKPDIKSSDKENPYKYLYHYIHPLVFGAVDRSSSLSMRICEEILQYHIQDKELISSITKRLNYDYPSHSFPITMREAIDIGLPVKEISFETFEILNQLQLICSELAEEQITDYDHDHYHDNSIYSIVETTGIQLRYHHNMDKHYRETQKRYLTINDASAWFKTSLDPKNGKVVNNKIFF